MIHLFNKVYLKPDTNFAKSKDSIIISPKAALWTKYPEMQSINTLDFGVVHYAEQTYSDLLTNNFDGKEENFLAWLLAFDNTRRLTIYCSPDVLRTLLYKWLKTLLKDMDSNTAYQLLRTYAVRYMYQWGYSYLHFVRLNDAEAAVYKAVGAALAESPAQVKTLWESTVPFANVDADMLAQIAGVEFQIASYLADSGWKYKAKLSDKVVAMVKKFQVRLLIDIKQDVLSRLVVLPGFDILNQTLPEYVAAHPEWNWLLDNNLLPDQYASVESNYDMNVVRNTALQYWHTKFGDTVAHYETDNYDAIKWLDPNITLDDILQTELNSPFCRKQLGQWEYAVSVNSQLLAHLLDLYKANNKPELTKYSLVTT